MLERMIDTFRNGFLTWLQGFEYFLIFVHDGDVPKDFCIAVVQSILTPQKKWCTNRGTTHKISMHCCWASRRGSSVRWAKCGRMLWGVRCFVRGGQIPCRWTMEQWMKLKILAILFYVCVSYIFWDSTYITIWLTLISTFSTARTHARKSLARQSMLWIVRTWVLITEQRLATIWGRTSWNQISTLRRFGVCFVKETTFFGGNQTDKNLWLLGVKLCTRRFCTWRIRLMWAWECASAWWSDDSLLCADPKARMLHNYSGKCYRILPRRALTARLSRRCTIWASSTSPRWAVWQRLMCKIFPIGPTKSWRSTPTTAAELHKKISLLSPWNNKRLNLYPRILTDLSVSPTYGKSGCVFMIAPLLAGEGTLGGLRGEYRSFGLTTAYCFYFLFIYI